MNHPQLPALNIGGYILTLALGAALLFAGMAAGQSAGIVDPSRGPSHAENYKFTTHSSLVFLPTRVQTKKGETIYGLMPDDFIVEDNGVRQSVRVDEDPDSTGVSLAVVVQCGRSAPSEFNKLKGLNTMIGEIVGDGRHEVAIVAYGGKPYVLDDFSSRPEAIPLALSRIKPCGDYHAATIDAVSSAINMLKRRQNDYRRAILLVSEMRDYGSRSKLPDVVAELGVNDIVIYSLAFSPTKEDLLRYVHGDEDQPQAAALAPPPVVTNPSSGVEAKSSPSDPTPLYMENPPILLLPPQIQLIIGALKANAAAELASLSGGEYINFATQKGFEDGLQRISNHIHDYYLLSFKPSSSPVLTLHTLSVRVADYPDAVIQTRKSYWPEIVERVAPR
ncbi:MAG TPA: VWA domain-containing protein [Terriglobia bacterium]|nr:VWA domain-containing protein [Terriglobia bacterium]